MTAPTVAVEWLLARAAVRSSGLLHVVSVRDSGALNPVCGANPIRSEKIERRHELDDLSLLCPGCATMAASIGGSVVDGVALLLGLSSSAAPTARLLEVRVDAIVSVAEPRKVGAGLLAAVRNNGIVTPLLVRRIGRGLQLLDGGRRLAAAKAAGLATVPAIVRDLDDEHAVVEHLQANQHRQDLDPIAQALAFVDALDVLGCTQTALADGLGISQSHVSNTIRLLKLPAHLQQHVADGLIKPDQARALLACKTAAEQDLLADRMLAARAGNPTAPRERAQLDDRLAGIAQLLTGVLDAKRVRLRESGDDLAITIVVAPGQRQRVLTQLGLAS